MSEAQHSIYIRILNRAYILYGTKHGRKIPFLRLFKVSVSESYTAVLFLQELNQIKRSLPAWWIGYF